MRQEVAYNRLKRQWKIIYRQAQKTGGGCLQEVVVHLSRSSNCKAWLEKFWCFGLAVAYGMACGRLR